MNSNNNNKAGKVLCERRAPPAIPKPITQGIICSTEGMGILVAKKEGTNELLWKVQVYKVEYIKGLETDVQDIVIKVCNIFSCMNSKKQDIKELRRKLN